MPRALKCDTLFLRESPVGGGGRAYARFREFVACSLGLQVPRGLYPEIPSEGVVRAFEGGCGSYPSGFVRPKGDRTVGGARDARPRSFVPEDSAQVQRVAHDWVSEGEECRSGSPGIAERAP